MQEIIIRVDQDTTKRDELLQWLGRALFLNRGDQVQENVKTQVEAYILQNYGTLEQYNIGREQERQNFEMLQQQDPSAPGNGRHGWQDAPETQRNDATYEEQRVETIALVQSNISHILNEAARFQVPAEAIVGAVVWEAFENPYPGWFPRSNWRGPGKVQHETGAIADQVEQSGLLPRQPNETARRERLQDFRNAITYVAAIMRFHANVYLNVAEFNINSLYDTKEIGIFCTLYQGGNSEDRAATLRERLQSTVDPNQINTGLYSEPNLGDDMSEWVLTYLDYIEQLITTA